MKRKTLLLFPAIIIIMFLARLYTGENGTVLDSELKITGYPYSQTERTMQTEYAEDTENTGYQYIYSDYITEISTDELIEQNNTDYTFTDNSDNSDNSGLSGNIDMTYISAGDVTDTINITDVIETKPQSTYDMSDAPPAYTLDEIKYIFNKSRDLFEKVKDICLSTGYGTTIYMENSSSAGTAGSRIFYRGNNQNDYSDVTETPGYEAIAELLDEYDIPGVTSLDYTNHYTKERESGIIFQMLICLPYEQNIVYSESKKITEEVADGNRAGLMKLDENWYYERIDHIMP